MNGEPVVPLGAGDRDADVAVVWKAPATELGAYPKLGLLCSLGAGVDHMISAAPFLPKQVRLTRLVDPLMAERMARHVLAVVLRKHRNLDLYEAQKRTKTWVRKFHDDVGETTVAVLGQGALGTAVSSLLSAVGFRILAWARSPRQSASWPVLAGAEGLKDAVCDAHFIVAVLPLTDETRGLLSTSLFRQMRPGAYLVNVGRGEHLVVPDLLAAIDEEHISGAALDVFDVEPLPADNPLWGAAKVLITPHVASLSNPKSGSEAIAEEIKAYRRNGALAHEVFIHRGY